MNRGARYLRGAIMRKHWVNNKSSEDARAGFTLMEGVVASFILTASAGALYSAILFMMTTVSFSANHMEAQTLAFDQALAVCHMDYDVLENYGVVTVAVPTNSAIFHLGGTLRTAVLPVSNRCTIITRVDWTQKTMGGTVNASETYSVMRYETSRQ